MRRNGQTSAQAGIPLELAVLTPGYHR